MIVEPADELIAELRAATTPDPFATEPECQQAIARIQKILSIDDPPISDPRPVPERLGEYRILEMIGRGGMGAVYRATHTRLGRDVALKVLPPDRAGDAAAARFNREMAAIGKLDHPNVVRATDAGEAAGVAFLVMDLVPGIDVARLVRACGPVPLPDACEIARQAAVGLQHLAGHGLVHRDIKPSNLMLDPRGVVKVLDLGLALSDASSGGDPGSGAVVGTYDYRAPELADRSRRPDARADVYSLGCTLYHLLAGRPPFSGPRRAAVADKLAAHAGAPIPEIRDVRPDASQGLSNLLRLMLAKNPDERYSTPAEVSEALAAFCIGCDLPRLLVAACDPGAQPVTLPPKREPVGRRWPTRAAVIAAVAVVAVAGVLAAKGQLWERPPNDTAQLPAPQIPPELREIPIPVNAEQPGSVDYPVALLGFEERGAGVKDLGPKVADLLLAKLLAKPDLCLVDRTDLQRVLDEQRLSLSGAVKPDDAVKVGQLTGAKLLVTGSVLEVDKKRHLIVKVIGTETGKVAGVSVEGATTEELGDLVGKLAELLAEKIDKEAPNLSPRPTATVDRIAELNKKLGKQTRPIVFVFMTNPAAQTEIDRFLKETGFELVDPDEGNKGKADILITGEGLSESAGRLGGLVSVRARMELRAVDRKSGKVIAVDRQTTVVVGASEQIAGKQALQDAAAALAERVIPKLVKVEKK